jgi:hypothetical protein
LRHEVAQILIFQISFPPTGSHRQRPTKQNG